MPPARALAVALALASVTGSAAVARAQNAEGFFYSEDAARTAGAVLARPGDDAALWYNPAGLAAIERSRVSANGSVFGLRVRNVPDAVVMRSGGARTALDLDATDIIAVPHALAITFNVTEGVTVGVGLFTTVRDVRRSSDLVLDARMPDVDGARSQRLDVQSDTSKYHLGPGIGVTVARGVRLGVAPLLTYRTDSTLLQYALAFDTPVGDSHEILQGSVARTLVGLTGALGLQADLSRVVHVGLTFRPPELYLHGASEGGTLTAVTDDPEGQGSEVVIVPEADPRSGSSMIDPARFGAGVWLTPSAAVAVGMDVEVSTGLDNPALGIARDAVVNGRIGVQIALSEELVVGGGLFTDFAPESEAPANLGAEVVDWVGGTLGATMRTPLALASKPEEEDALVLSTTLALRYAVGVGRAAAIDFDDTITNPLRDVVYHDVMPFLGSSIHF